MQLIEPILRNFIVQIFLGIGGMVFLIMLGEAIKSMVHRQGQRGTKELETRIRNNMQGELAKMRAEMESLKHTLIEHSMSLDSNVESLQRRIEHQEQRAQNPTGGSLH